MNRKTLTLGVLCFAALAASSRAQTLPPKGNDIIAASSGDLSLGKNWYPHETAGGQRFRWVDNDAQIVVHHAATSLVPLTLALEAGPGMNATRFPFQILDSSGRQVAGVMIDGKQTLTLLLPAPAGSDATFSLHVIGGGHRIPQDKRVLNFRVFELSDGTTGGSMTQSRDIVDPRGPISLGSGGWYGLETYAGKTFRWVNNDAPIRIHSDAERSATLRLTLEAGPGVGAPSVRLRLRNGGSLAGERTATNLATVAFPVKLQRGTNTFVLHVEGGGKAAPHDPRTLNVRVFSLSLGR